MQANKSAHRHGPFLAWRRLAASILLMLLAACGGGDPDTTAAPGSGDGSDAGAGDGSSGGNGTGGSGAADFRLIPPAVQLGVDGQTTLLALRPPGMPSWSSSDPAIARVDANGQVTALAKGSAVISASAGASIASARVDVYRSRGADRDPTSTSLIAQALARGTIDAEQALTYRVYAQFGDARLPAAYDGAPDAAPDHMLLRDVATRLGTLSPATQGVLRPFLLPPIYLQSAHAQALGGASGPDARARIEAYAARPRPLDINCNVAAGPSAYGRVSATTTDSRFTFNVFYFPMHGDDPDPQAALARQIAAAAVDAYGIETGVIDRFPLSDAGLPCNGGDAGIDIYLVPLNNLRLAGQTIGYGERCASVPSFVVLNLYHPVFFSSLIAPSTDSTGAVESIVAHELLHVLQLAMTRQASCDDTRWFDEATAEWAMDLVVPTIPRSQLAAPGLEDGLPRVGGPTRSGGFLAEYLYVDHLLPLEKGAPDSFGYASYLFFQYLARAQTPAAIRQIYDAMAGGRNSVEAIGAAIDMTAVWPEFAKTLWNDHANRVLDYWSQEDGYDWGLADVFSSPARLEGATAELKPLAIDQQGRPDTVFTLLDNALLASASGDYEIPPRSMIYEQLKFTDAAVHTVVFSNPIAGTPNNEYMKLQVVKKIGGAWKAPEDWTHEPFKAFCLDQKDERLEELLVIVSNSETNRPSEQPFRISLRGPMQVSTSNVGCWRFEGTATTTTTRASGPVTVESATVTFDRFQNKPPLDLPDSGLASGYDLLAASGAGRVGFTISGFDTQLGCSISGSADAAMTGDNDGSLIVNFGLPVPLYRLVIGEGARTIPGVRLTSNCHGNVETFDVDENVRWLSMPNPGAAISADGQRINGRWDRTDEDGAKTTVWDFRSIREQ